jgi:2-methylcitrate dehydratase PrpD
MEAEENRREIDVSTTYETAVRVMLEMLPMQSPEGVKFTQEFILEVARKADRLDQILGVRDNRAIQAEIQKLEEDIRCQD